MDNDLSIFIAVDSEKDFVLIQNVLKQKLPSFKITRTTSVLQTARALKENKPDILLLDLNLYDSIGPRTVADIRAVDPNTPIIALTGIATSLTVSECEKAGANYIFTKSDVYKDGFVDILLRVLKTE
nr:response regulator [Cytophagales bacterium]